jgi:hypothetical protein
VEKSESCVYIKGIATDPRFEQRKKNNVEMADKISFAYVVNMSIYLRYLDRYFN